MRKLIDFYADLLLEATAGEEAKKRGLKSIGFGRYADPSTNKVVAKSVNGKLVAVKPQKAGKKTPRKAAPDHPIGKKIGVSLAHRLLKGGREEHMELVHKLAKLPLKKLRSAQTKLIPVLQKFYSEKNIKGMEMAQLVDDILAAAVDENAFGEEDRKAAGIKGSGPSPERARAMKAIRKVFGGKGQVGMLQKDKVIDGQRQIWVDVSRAADSLNIRTQSQYENWLKRKENKMKRAIAANPSLEGFVPVFKQGPRGGGVSIVLVREEE